MSLTNYEMTQTDIDFKELNTILPFMKDGMSLDDIQHLCLIYDVSFEKFEDVFTGKFRAVSGMPTSQKKKLKGVDEEEISEMSQTDIYLILNTR